MSRPETWAVTASAPGYPPFTESVVVSPVRAYGTLDFSLLRTGATKVFNAAADAYVKGDSPTKNYGNDAALRVRSGSPAYATYLKFNVTGLLGRPVTGAQLRIFTTDPSPDGGHVFLAGSGWTETAITWNNAPLTTGSQIGAFGAVTAGSWGVLDLPASLISGEGPYTFKVVGQSTNSAYYSSRQGTSPPELDLTLGVAPAGAPVAGITASPTSGAVPLTVTFSDASTGGPNGWAWDFADGTSSNVQFPPAHIYTTAGTYVVSLIASNANGPSAAATKTITVGAAPTAPVAAFTASATSGTAPLTVTFSDASTGGPSTWAWNFGDGTSSTVQFPPAHTYTTANTYTVSLIASNSTGPSAPATKTITVGSIPPPPPPGGNPIKTMTFEGTSLTDPVTGADSVTGALVRETASPILGSGSVRIPNLSAGYVQEGFTAAPDLFVAFDLRLTARPLSSSRMLLISDQGTTVGNLQVLPTGQLRLRNVSTTIGVDSTALVVGTVYRVGIHQRKGTGSNGVLEAFLAPVGGAFGSPFATLTTGSWTTSADRIRLGATAGGALDVTADNIALDAGAMPAPPIALSGATIFVVATTLRTPSVAQTSGPLFDCMIPFTGDSAPQARVTPAAASGASG